MNPQILTITEFEILKILPYTVKRSNKHKRNRITDNYTNLF